MNAVKSKLNLLNRELGALEFNRRVLSLAQNLKIPLLERLKYICIVSSNMDEFFEIRIAVLKEQLRKNPKSKTQDGLIVGDAYLNIVKETQTLVSHKYKIFQKDILPRLEREGIHLHFESAWTPSQHRWAKTYFEKELVPLLTPIVLDPAHPFPKVINKSLNFFVTLEGKDDFGRTPKLAVVQAPRSIPRVIQMPARISQKPYGIVILSTFMQSFVHELFPGMKITGCYQFRVTRNSDLFVSDDDISDLKESLKGELSTRHLGDAVRLEISSDIPDHLLKYLRKSCDLNPEDCYRVDGPVNLMRLMQVADIVNRPDLKFPAHTPKLPLIKDTIFDELKTRDILLHHPYESFEPVLNLLKTASKDPDVLAIKQTIYRTGNISPVMDALIEAAKNGKEVTVIVELLARFDEETNISWAAKLEEVGAHVVYGVVKHKCHAKMIMIVRKELLPAKGKRKPEHILKRYVHLGTGNYHPRTAKLYTDFGLMTSNISICDDVHKIFMQLTGTSRLIKLKSLWHSPFTMFDQIVKHIQNEAKAARLGKPARIVAKVNSLLEPAVINELYKASQAGVKIDLIVRGVCALKPKVKGLSENIRVRSIVGQFLEHHRIFYFYAHGKEEVYLSSADWMDRNLFRRIEVAFPILDPELKQKVINEGLNELLKDVSSWNMNADGLYKQSIPSSNVKLSGQQNLLLKYSVAAKPAKRKLKT
ncbi:Ppk Polyphosphate kinase [Candidatus Methylopumilus planktonicus]|uniref:polyphosphate kinase 1 n=1 Tax=Candidatus Methylopumilus planktonicus TaxID=1581557 RepID=UPI003BEEE664